MTETTRIEITKDMSIMEIIEKNPNAIKVFQKHGLGCIGCMAAHYETVEQGAQAHGLDIEELMKDLNE